MLTMKNPASKSLTFRQYRNRSANIYAQETSVVAKIMSDITFRPFLSSYDLSPWYERDDVPSISHEEYAALLSATWGTLVVFVPLPSLTHRDREKWLSSFLNCSKDSEESISDTGEHRGMEVVLEHHGMEVVPEARVEDFGAGDVGSEVVGAEVVGAENVGVRHHGIQVAVEEGPGEGLDPIPVPSQALFFDLNPAEIQILGRLLVLCIKSFPTTERHQTTRLRLFFASGRKPTEV